jgi:hypothetical protein
MAASPVLTSFSGPLTAVAINEWFLRCEKKFAAWDSQTSSKLTDTQKVQLAGDHISPDGATHELSDWWNNLDSNITWRDFKDAFKSEALGTSWRARALEAFYSTKQNFESVLDYTQSLEEKRSVIKHGTDGIYMKDIDDLTFKCHMVFNANPILTAKIMDDAGFDLITDPISTVKQKLKIAASSVGGADLMRRGKYFTFVSWEGLSAVISHDAKRAALKDDLLNWSRQDLDPLPWSGGQSAYMACAAKAEDILRRYGLSIRKDIETWYQLRSKAHADSLPAADRALMYGLYAAFFFDNDDRNKWTRAGVVIMTMSWLMEFVGV